MKFQLLNHLLSIIFFVIDDKHSKIFQLFSNTLQFQVHSNFVCIVERQWYRYHKKSSILKYLKLINKTSVKDNVKL